MPKQALVVIDLQNDITKHYRDIIDAVNEAILYAKSHGMEIVYIKHNVLGENARSFRPGSKGADFVPELRIESDNVFVKTKASALTSEAFCAWVSERGVNEFYIVGADATACVKSTCFNMAKAGYAVRVLSDCVTSYDMKKLDEMLSYYERQGCEVAPLKSLMK